MGRNISRLSEWGWQVAVAFLVSVFVVFWGNDFLGAYDWVQFHSFNREYLLEALKAGRLPFWNPYIYLGRPFLADTEVAALYPTTYLHAFMPAKFALAATIFVHTLFSLRGIRALLNEVRVNFRWIPCAAIGWVMSGVIVSRLLLGNIGYANGLAWLPWLFYYCERWTSKRDQIAWLKLVLVITGVFLSGNPQVVWSCALWTVVYVVARNFRYESVYFIIKRALLTGIGVCGAFFMSFALVAIQLLPFTNMIVEGNRDASPVLAAAFSLNWADLMSLGQAAFNPMISHEADLFVGCFLTLAGLLSLKYWRIYPCLRGFLAVGIVSLVISLGRHTPLFEFMCHVVPGLTGFRLHSRTVAVIPLIVSAMGAIALTGNTNGGRLGFGWVILISVIGILFLTTAFSDGMQVLILVAVGIGLFGCWIRPGSRYIVWIACAIVAIEGGYHLIKAKHMYGGAGSKGAVASDLIFVKKAVSSRTVYPVRVYMPAGYFAWNAPMAVGLSTIGGYAALASDRVWCYLHYAAGLEPSYIYNTFPAVETTLAGLNVYSLADASVMLGLDGKHLEVNVNPAGRAWIVGELLPARNYKEAISFILNEKYPKDRAYTEDATQVVREISTVADPKPKPFSLVEWDKWAPERLELSWKTAERDGVLVLAEAWYPGWQANVNGHERPVFPVNGWMRGVKIKPGENQVVLTYHQPGLWQGCLVSGLAWIAWFILYWRARTRVPVII